MSIKTALIGIAIIAVLGGAVVMNSRRLIVATLPVSRTADNIKTLIPTEQPSQSVDWWVQRGFRSVNPSDEERLAITRQQRISVPMQRQGGMYVVPVLINNAITLNFVVDSGAADVHIPADVVMTLMRRGTLKESDFLGQKTYVLADGSTVPSQTFRIRSLKVGNKVLENVNGSASVKGIPLLGQSFLGRFKSWSVDNNKHALVLE